MKQAHVYIYGFVQGVGFRRFVQRKALVIGLMGWVRNLPDRRVEVVLQGRIEDIEKIILLCRKGPFLSEVESVEVIWEDTKETFIDFQISLEK